MPAWIIQALRLLGIGAGISAGGELLGVGEAGRGIPLLPAPLDPFERGGLQFPGIFKKEEGKRRRRRRALTQGDRDDIAFITGMLGSPAGKQFALTLAGRSR